jgi:hypothetical protein
MIARRVLYGVMLRRLGLALGLVVIPAAALATPTAPATPPSTAPEQVRNGGTIDGRLTTVDYQRGVLGVDAGSRGRMSVSVMPSTSIQGRDTGYHTVTDLRPGERVQILSSIADGKYVAQIIRIR